MTALELTAKSIELKSVDQSQSVTVRKAELIDLWERGVLTPLAYVHMALQIEGLDKPLDIDYFIHNWRGTTDPDTGRVKRLTRKQVLVAIATLEDKEILEFTATQLTLNFL